MEREWLVGGAVTLSMGNDCSPGGWGDVKGRPRCLSVVCVKGTDAGGRWECSVFPWLEVFFISRLFLCFGVFLFG